MKEYKMFINGEWTGALSGKKREIINPANGKTIAVVPEAGREDSKIAIEAARKAFDSGEWSSLPGSRRGRLLYLLAELIEKDHENLAQLESLNTGKTVEESRWDMNDIAGIFRYFAGMADKESGEVIDSPNPGTESLVIREPVGVCGLICPWNYPLLQASWKMAPALAAGCTIVMKASEITPLTTIRITELAVEAGFPAGVINTVTGPGDAGAELAESHDVDLVSFTGGIETGKKIMRAASCNVKKIALELGGKNPNIIFDDADFDTALDFALNGVFFHAGQICSAGTRLLVQDTIYEKFIEALKSRMEKIKLGDGFNPETEMGPLISEEHRRKVERYVNEAVEKGANLVLGGKRPGDPSLKDGFFYMPTLFRDCTEDMPIVKEEVFGPVITVEKFYTEEEALRKANSTIYGLSAGFWTNDQSRIHRMSRNLRFGTVWVNDFNVYFTQAPWGGYKQSGFGRELGKTGYEEYTELKHIYRNYSNSPVNWFGTK
ncbi:MAG TPA: betaine-aldehyde dehydrogenase [Spirochaetota bacterium]|nr:betaine-aldehyde dehydrogenase [Spirochaetota bacterium]